AKVCPIGPARRPWRAGANEATHRRTLVQLGERRCRSCAEVSHASARIRRGARGDYRLYRKAEAQMGGHNIGRSGSLVRQSDGLVPWRAWVGWQAASLSRRARKLSPERPLNGLGKDGGDSRRLEEPAFLVQPLGLDIARCRNQGSARK